jgi:ubiquinone/menaquinone biosynthesis C-methylase UbiE
VCERLGLDSLTAIYARLAGRFDWQHRLITAAAEQRGREMLVEGAVREGDRALDCGAGTGSTGLMAELTSSRVIRLMHNENAPIYVAII